MQKSTSLYSTGLKPFAYSLKRNSSWIEAGDSISYKLSNANSNLLNCRKRFYTLEWKYIYEYGNDEVYFAQFVPYTYNDLLMYLKGIKEDTNKSSIVRLDMMCRTLAKNGCPMLTITENVKNYLSYNHEQELSGMSKSTRKIIYNRIEENFSKGHKKPTTNFHNGNNTNKNNKAKYGVEGIKNGENEESDLSKTHDLEAELIKHKRSHNGKKGIIIVSRVHPGNILIMYRRGARFMGNERFYRFFAIKY